MRMECLIMSRVNSGEGCLSWEVRGCVNAVTYISPRASLHLHYFTWTLSVGGSNAALLWEAKEWPHLTMKARWMSYLLAGWYKSCCNTVDHMTPAGPQRPLVIHSFYRRKTGNTQTSVTQHLKSIWTIRSTIFNHILYINILFAESDTHVL